MLKRDEITKLFQDTKGELEQCSSDTSIELELPQLHEFSQAEHEHLAILFDLANEELRAPGSEKRYLDLAQLAENHVAESSELAKALRRFEHITDRAIKPNTLTTGSALARPVSSSYRQPVARAAQRVVPAPASAQLAALVIDIGICALLAGVIAALYSPFIQDALFHDHAGKVGASILMYASLIAIYFKSLLFTLIGYSCIMLLTRGKTFGLARNRIKLVSENGAPPRAVQKVIRSLLIPLAILTLSPMAIARGRKSLSDTFSRTLVCKI